MKSYVIKTFENIHFISIEYSSIIDKQLSFTGESFNCFPISNLVQEGKFEVLLCWLEANQNKRSISSKKVRKICFLTFFLFWIYIRDIARSKTGQPDIYGEVLITNEIVKFVFILNESTLHLKSLTGPCYISAHIRFSILTFSVFWSSPPYSFVYFLYTLLWSTLYIERIFCLNECFSVLVESLSYAGSRHKVFIKKFVASFSIYKLIKVSDIQSTDFPKCLRE